MSERQFRDNGETIYDFLSHKILLTCPRCQECAFGFFSYGSSAKITCNECGFHKVYERYGLGNGYFCETELWLKTNCCSEKLWAYNQEHLEFIESYIGATLREKIPNINQSLASRLPVWMTKSSNRSQVLKGIQKLKNKLVST